VKEHFRTLTADKITKYTMAATIVIFAIQLVFLAINFGNLPPVIPVFNQLPWGIERLGTRLSIFFPLTAAFICSGTNLILASITYESMPLIARVMGFTSFLVSLICLIFTVRTILLIT